MNDFSTIIIDWYETNKRDLPWRHEVDPYLIWLSEVILQQTQVIQGLDYYLKFSNRYPTVKILAAAEEEEVLKLWQGLGYYSRARNMHYAAKQIMQDFNGQFPKTYNDIIKLKGVGEYTAAAISSFAYHEPKAVVDGNVFRVLSRLYEIDTPINSSDGKKLFSKIAIELLNPKFAAIHNQAIMELGALICRPKNPKCDICPVSHLCNGFENNTKLKYPIKDKKINVKNRFLNYLVISDGEYLLIRKRDGLGIWQGLYDFPLIESEKEISELNEFMGLNLSDQILDLKFKHLLSHQKLNASFWIINVQTLPVNSGFIKIKIQDLVNYPLPQLFVRYISQSNFFKR